MASLPAFLCFFGSWFLVVSLCLVSAEPDTQDDCQYPVFDKSAGDLYRPKSIPSNSTCIWTISPSLSDTSDIDPLLVFKSVVLGPEDTLSIINDIGENVIFGPYSGNEVPQAILTGVMHFSIVLTTSDDVLPYKRHLWAFVDMKDKTYNSKLDTGHVLSSPVYRYHRFDPVLVTYKLPRPSQDEKLSVVFESFNVSGRTYLEVIGSDGSDAIYKEKPPDIISQAKSSIIIKFNLDCKEPFQEFQISFELTVAACSGRISLDKDHPKQIVSFAATRVPDKHYLICRQIVTSPEGHFIQMEFTEVRMTSSLDLFTVNDGGKYSPNLFIVTAENANQSEGRVIMSSKERAWLSYISTNLVGGDDQYITLVVSMQRYGGFYGNPSHLTYYPSPIDFSRPRLPNIIFLLEVPTDYDILVTVLPSPLNHDPESYIAIYNDHNQKSVPFATVKNLVSTRQVLVPNHRAMVILRSFSNVQTFEGEFDKVIKGCYKISTSEIGSFELPHDLDSATKCSWIVRPSKSLENDIILLKIHTASFCPGDSILIGELKSQQNPVVINRTLHHVMFHFNGSNGFNMTFQASGQCSHAPFQNRALEARYLTTKGCGETINLGPGEQVQIISPGYPHSYPLGVKCFWKLKSSDSANGFHFSLLNFHIQEDDLLRVNRTVLFGDANAKQSSIGDLPSDWIEASNEIHIEFISSTQIQSNAAGELTFWLQITAIDCGGHVSNSSGLIETLDFPQPFENGSNCIWIIDALQSLQKKEQILQFSLIQGNPLDDDNYAISILDGTSLRDRSMIPVVFEVPLSSRSSHLFVFYKRRDHQKPARGIRLNFKVLNESDESKANQNSHDTENGSIGCDSSQESGATDYQIANAIQCSLVFNVLLMIATFLAGGIICSCISWYFLKRWFYQNESRKKQHIESVHWKIDQPQESDSLFIT